MRSRDFRSSPRNTPPATPTRSSTTARTRAATRLHSRLTKLSLRRGQGPDAAPTANVGIRPRRKRHAPSHPPQSTTSATQTTAGTRTLADHTYLQAALWEPFGYVNVRRVTVFMPQRRANKG